jgi:Na+-transporting methylmalonyl-CoA/oxaloacetate decarboxylase gamma subunit
VGWNFGTFLWSTLVVFFWFTVIWMFIAIFADILRRDMSGWAKAGWIVVIVVLPFLGMLIYVIGMSATARHTAPAVEPTVEPNRANGSATYNKADEIATAARLYDEGKITTDEYQNLKQQALSR